MKTDPGAEPRVAPVPPSRRREALELLGRGSVPFTDQRARRVSEAAERAGVDFDQLWGAFDEGGTMTAAALLVYRPGRTAMIFGSAPDGAAMARSLAVLLDHLSAQARPRDASLVQALVDPEDRLEVEALLDAGFQHLAELQYMQRSIPRRPSQPPPLPEGVTLEPYAPDRHEAFIAALDRSYIETRDCPMLRGLRATPDVLAGHMNGGHFEPELWTLARLNGEPQGLMLLNVAEPGMMELIYLGLGPAVRGMGLGEALLSRAMQWGANRGIRTMSLAVDTHNDPAMRLYQRLGFYRVARRIALVRAVNESVD